jgi:hypothetical protein
MSFLLTRLKKKISKILDTHASSLPSKHNSGHQLPEEPTVDNLRAPLVWVHCGIIVLLLQQPIQRPYSGPRSFTI